MEFDDQGRAVLSGDGSYGFKAVVDGEDLVVRNVRATWFGGDDDPLDSGMTASGVVTKGNPGCMGCALPMDIGARLRRTQGSPLPKVPWQTTVRVWSHASQEIIEVPVIDIGPAKPPAAHAALDLTQAAFRALGGKIRDGEMQVDYRIIGGARHLAPAVRARIEAHRAERR